MHTDQKFALKRMLVFNIVTHTLSFTLAVFPAKFRKTVLGHEVYRNVSNTEKEYVQLICHILIYVDKI